MGSMRCRPGGASVETQFGVRGQGARREDTASIVADSPNIYDRALQRNGSVTDLMASIPDLPSSPLLLDSATRDALWRRLAEIVEAYTTGVGEARVAPELDP